MQAMYYKLDHKLCSTVFNAFKMDQNDNSCKPYHANMMIRNEIDEGGKRVT